MHIMMSNSQTPSIAGPATRLDRTLKALQDMVKEQEATLKQLRASAIPIETEPSYDPKVELQQIFSIKAAYESLNSTEPWLPGRDSVLPALLALRTTDRWIHEINRGITSTRKELQDVRSRVEKEESDLRHAKAIRNEIQARTLSLQEQVAERTQKLPTQIVKDMMKVIRQKKVFYDGETGKLVKTYNDFIDDHLASMLAVEELGGPIVGDSLDIDDEILEGAFNTKGKPKKLKPKEDKRQQRIDQIWGSRPDFDDTKGPRNEKELAAAEMRHLTELLLNGLVQAQGSGPGSYVKLSRESAAARFLVRSKVAQFHPTDATRIRLVDFGGDIDD